MSLAQAESSERQAVSDDWQDLSWQGQFYLQMNLDFYRRPSSLEGHNHSDFGMLSTQQMLSLQDKPLFAYFDLEVAPSSSTNGQQPTWTWQALYIQSGLQQLQTNSDQVDKSSWVIQFGLLDEMLQRRDRLSMSFERLGMAFQTGLLKWKIIPRSDLGLRLKQFINENHNLYLQITNGEGWPQRNQGNQYDYELGWLHKKQWRESQFSSALFYRQGRYEKLSVDQSLKKRTGLELSYTHFLSENKTEGSDFWQIGTLATQIQDPVDGIDGIVAGGAKLSLRGGLEARGQLIESWFQLRGYWLPRNYRIYGTSSDYKIDEEQPNKKVNQVTFGVGYYLSKGMLLDIALDDTEYGPDFASGVSSETRWFVSWSWLMGHLDTTASARGQN